MSIPIDHHYLPVFYLSEWISSDGRLCRFSKPYGDRVKAHRVVPKGTAFERRLYTTRGLPADRAQTMESDFMARVDDAAARALALLKSGLPEADWTPSARSAWSRFLMTQLFRTPEEIQRLKALVKQEWSKSLPELQAAYETCRPEGAPASVDEFLLNASPEHEDAFAFQIGRTLMDHSGIGQVLNHMAWGTIELPPGSVPLMTSDRPIWMTTTLVEPNALLTMPIGPKRIFVACRSTETLRRLKGREPAEMGVLISQLAVEHAVKYVYSIDDQLLSFVRQRMATNTNSHSG